MPCDRRPLVKTPADPTPEGEQDLEIVVGAVTIEAPQQRRHFLKLAK
jgi:hypothetical protein